MSDRCSWSRCRSSVTVGWHVRFNLCEKHLSKPTRVLHETFLKKAVKGCECEACEERRQAGRPAKPFRLKSSRTL